ncbi:MAG: hypothetical protein QNJ72_15590 [Pleurocapsa sp. MO_226.B13]|nr:hypothetical protein [Pleurocapsa sp. MO_226.B13]
MILISQKRQLVERLIKHNNFNRVKIEKMVFFSTTKTIESLDEDELDELIEYLKKAAIALEIGNRK